MRLKLKSIFPTLYDFVNFSIETITSFYPDFIDMHNYEPLQAEIERYICKPIYRQFKNSSCNYLPTEEGIDAFKDQFSNQLEEVVFDFLIYTSTNINYFNEVYNLEGQNLEQNVNTINSPINQHINNTKATTNIASGATAQSINLMVYNGKTTWRKAFSSYYTPQRKSELIDSFRWLFINFYTDDEDGAVIVEIEEELNMADGNQVITPEDNEIVRKVTIEKPETLNPNNIRKDVNIGGVVGNMEGRKNEVQLTLPLDMANGNMVITPHGDDVLSAVTINKPETLVPSNIKDGVNIGGVVGSYGTPTDFGLIYQGKWRVRYFDVDGTILKIEYVENGGRTTPPTTNPNYDPQYLIFDGWNYDIENLIVNQPIDIGVAYKTVNDLTYLFVKAVSKTVRLSFTNFVSIDWGDGTINTENSHTYENYGDYVIKVEGNFSFNTSSSQYMINPTGLLKKVYLTGRNNLASYAFQNCRNLEVVALCGISNIPNEYSFRNTAVKCVIGGKKAFDSSSTNMFFNGAYKLKYIVSTENNFSQLSIYDCYNIDDYGCCKNFTSNSNNSTYNSIVKNFIFGYNFTNANSFKCYVTGDIFILGDTPPVLGSNSGISSTYIGGCIIWVKDETLEDMKVASGWSSYASKMRPLSQYPNY